MDSHDHSGEHLADRFRNRLAGDVAETRAAARALPRRRWLLALLLLVALVPRVWSAWHWDIVCTDAVSYLESAEALRQGKPESAFSWLGLNTYPVILTWLGAIGPDTAAAGEWWNIAMATLAVLPLFGWVRRQFDDRVAAAACVLYAFQPMLVRFTPLLIRDPTFWLLFNLTLYLLWRSVLEIRWWLFLATGLGLTLTVHTRTEGWILVVPAVLWAAFRLPAVAGSRRRLVLGAVACLAVIPLSVTLVNLTWLRECPRWGAFRAGHVKMARAWVRSQQRPVSGPSTGSGASAAGACKPASKIARQIVVRLAKSFSYVYLLLAALGSWNWRRVCFRRDHQTLFLMNLLLGAAIWIRCSGSDICMRYFLPMVMVSLPWIALGAFAVRDWAVRLTGRFLHPTPKRRLVLSALLLAAVALISLVAAAPGPGRQERQKAAMGKWVLRRFGPNQSILCVNSDARLAYHYAQGRGYTCYVFRRFSARSMWHLLETQSPQVILLWENFRCPDSPNAALDALSAKPDLRYERVPPERLPPGCRTVVAMIRSDDVAKEASAPAAYRR